MSALTATVAGAITVSDIDLVTRPFGGCRSFSGALESIGSNEALIRCLARYVQFNAAFGSGVASLAGAIGARRDLFRDRADSIADLSDRSVEIAATIFYAAIDEFGGSKCRYPTHRAMARQLLKSAALHSGCPLPAEMADSEFSPAVCEGYGIGRKLDDNSLFAAIGFHLGSELLADEEFGILDRFLRSRFPGLVSLLEQDRTGGGHAAYLWIQLHTKVEADHFETALRGADRAVELYSGRAERREMRDMVLEGAKQFAAVQAGFMSTLVH
jgi:hypothetical protein